MTTKYLQPRRRGKAARAYASVGAGQRLGVLLIPWLFAGWLAATVAAAAEPFTVVVLPDTQYYTQTEANNTLYFAGQTNWIAANKDARNIAFVLHLGDIQNDGNPFYARTDAIYEPDFTRPTGLVPDDAQFRRADAAIDILDAAGVPYSLLAGNHDFIDHNIKDEPIYYLKWFGPQRYAGKPTFGGASPATPTTKWAGMNTWHTFDAGGYQFLNIASQFAADVHDLAWAQSVINANPGMPTILTTHALLNTTGYQSGYQHINDLFVRNNPQIVMTLNGHINGTHRQTATNIAGQPVQQMLVDYQSTILPGAPFKGGGYLRTMEFDVDEKVVRVESYSPIANAFLTDSSNQFTLPLDLPARFGGIDEPGIQHTTTFQQGRGGYSGTRDTFLSAAAPTTGNATASGLWVDGDAGTASAVQPRQALLRFDDLFGDSRIPVDAVIDSATLALRTSTTPNSHSADAMSLVRMLGAWSDTSTWSSLAGGVTADGTEAILAPNATFVPAVNGGALSMDVTESLYAWRSGAPNRGWALLPGGSDGWRFESAESALVADRPALTVTYTVRLASADLVIAVNEGSQTQSQAGCPVIVGRASVTKQGPGTVVFDAVNGHTGTTVVESGTLVIGRSDTLLKSPLVVRPGAAVVVGPGLTLQSPSVTVAGGMIDVGRGRIEIAAGGSSEQQLRADVIAGRSGGGLAGRTGIVTSAGPAGESSESLVGYRVFADGSAVVSWAAAGDTNLDRVIDILDVADFIAGGMFNTGLAASWSEGDFGYDGVVDILDVAEFLATNLFDAGPYDGALAPQPLPLGAVAAVPEPNVSGLTMCLVGLVLAASRRRRQSSAGVSSRRRNNWSAWSRGQRVAEAGGLDALAYLSTSRPG